MRSPASLMLCLSIALVTLPCAVGTAHAGPSISSPEYAERNGIQLQVEALLGDEDFAGLEALANRYRRSGEATTSGTLKLTHFYEALSNLYEADQISLGQDDPMRDRITRWVKKYPRSPTSHVAMAATMLGRGMAYRGYGYSSSISAEDAAHFHAYTEAASNYLAEHKKKCASDAGWYELALSAAVRLNWEATDLVALVDEGMAKHPGDTMIPFMAAQYFAPKWGGSPYAVESMARRALEAVPEHDRPALYARIYWSTAGSYYSSPFAEKQVDWPLMSQGIDDVLARYPSDWNLQNFAHFACQAGDKAKTRSLMDRITLPMELHAWWDADVYEHCRQWSREAS